MASTRVSACFADIGDLGRAAGFDVGFRQLDSGAQEIAATLQFGEHITLVRMGFNRAYHQLGAPPKGMTTFGIPICRLRNWFGRDYEASSILPFNVPNGIDGVSEPGFQGFTLSVADEFVCTVSEDFGVPMAEILVKPSPVSVVVGSERTQLLRRSIWMLFAEETGQINSEVEDDLIVGLLSTSLSNAAVIDTSRTAERSRAVAKAMAYISEKPGESVTVRDLCSKTEVALRTLNRAFRERFGIGPKAYLVRQRLSEVHAELFHAPADTLVADVANRHGFWHMGQFAKDYRKTFGELPSETLKRSRVENRPRRYLND